jgi:hypothetical protein
MDPVENATPGFKVKAKAEFVPARWWQALDFIRISLETMRGVGDPWVDSILARPCSPSSWLEYGYMLDNFWHSDAFFVVVRGQRAGTISLRYKPEYIYLETVGLLPKFWRGNIGQQVASFITNHCLRTRYQWMVASAADRNRAIRILYRVLGGRRLGLSTTTLALITSPALANAEIELEELDKPTAQQAWQRWRLYEVERVAGHEAVEIAFHLVGKLSRGKYLALYRDGTEIGFAIAYRRKGEADIEIFPSQEFWSNEPSAGLVAAIASHLKANVRRMTLTQMHANTLVASESFDFERHQEKERHLVVFKRAWLDIVPAEEPLGKT